MLRNAVLAALGGLSLSATAAAAQPVPRNFDKGTVTLVQEWKVAPGKLNAFMQDYATNSVKGLEIGKKVGGIVGYGVSVPVVRKADEANVYTIIAFKDLASFDRSYARAEQTNIEVYGSLAKAAEAAAKRNEYTTFVGSRLLQGLTITK